MMRDSLRYNKLDLWRTGLIAIVGGVCGIYFALASRRFSTFHNETFDLAFYHRIAWGSLRGNFWEPMVGGHVLGLHISPILIPLGWIGELFGYVPTLLFSQVLAIATFVLIVHDFARDQLRKTCKKKRRFIQESLAIVVACAALFSANFSHVLTFEFHPGTLAIPFLALLTIALHRRSQTQFWIASVLLLCCREDFGLCIFVTSALLYHQTKNPFYFKAAAGAFVYVALFLFVLIPVFGPQSGSLGAHFGIWGGSPLGVIPAFFHDPWQTLSLILSSRKLLGIATLITPWIFLIPRSLILLVPTIPIFAQVLLSGWPDVADPDSHYLSALLPFFSITLAAGLSKLSLYKRIFVSTFSLATTILMLFLFGSFPNVSTTWSTGYSSGQKMAFRVDQRTIAAEEILRNIPPEASVQAPDELLPHLASRPTLYRGVTHEHKVDYVILSVKHREKWHLQGTLLRNDEEINLRRWLSKTNYETLKLQAPYLLLRHKSIQEEKPEAFSPTVQDKKAMRLETIAGRTLTSCLDFLEVHESIGNEACFYFRANKACPNDLAFRIGSQPFPWYIYLPFQGAYSPSKLEKGQVVASCQEISRIDSDEIFIGAISSDEKKIHESDPNVLKTRLISLREWTGYRPPAPKITMPETDI